MKWPSIIDLYKMSNQIHFKLRLVMSWFCYYPASTKQKVANNNITLSGAFSFK